MKGTQSILCHIDKSLSRQLLHKTRILHNLNEATSLAEIVNTQEQLRQFRRQFCTFGRSEGKLEGIAQVDILAIGDGWLHGPSSLCLCNTRFFRVALIFEQPL